MDTSLLISVLKNDGEIYLDFYSQGEKVGTLTVKLNGTELERSGYASKSSMADTVKKLEIYKSIIHEPGLWRIN